MEYKIIADSLCDMTPQLKDRMDIVSIPLTINMGDKEFTDDDSLDMGGFMSQMKECSEKISTASPPALAFQEAMEKAWNSFVITLSKKLSSTYESAVLGKKMAEEKGVGDIHIFDTKSAVAGETLVAIKIRELLQLDLSAEHIVQTVSKFIDNMKTYFVLERYNNLINNGRINHLVGQIISILKIKLIMGADGDGGIKLFSKVRGIDQMIERLLSYIRGCGRETTGENAVISHCNNEPLALKLRDAIERQFNFKEIFIVPTGGVSSVYADDKVIVFSF